MITNHYTTREFNKYYPLLVISLCASFLFYKYVLQIYPSIITDQLMREFNLTGVGLGNLVASFYYSYMIVQLFVGIILDKFSTRLVTTAAIFSCALGAFLFSGAHDFLTASLSRGLMGAGFAFATVAYMQLAAAWFHPSRYAFVSGLLATAAMTGAVFGQAPLSFAMNELGWRYCLMLVGITGFILTVLFLLIVRDAPKNGLFLQEQPEPTFKEIFSIFLNKQNWLLTLYSGLAFCPIAVFGGLWGNPFLQAAYHIDKTQASFMVSLVFMGLGLGSPLIGMISDWLQNRRSLMFTCTLISCFAICLVLYCTSLPIWALASLLFIYGFALGAFMLVFATAKEMNPIGLIATVVAMINSSDAILDAITEPAIGKLLDLTWNGSIVDGVHRFSLSSYQLALSVLPVYLFIAALLVLMIKVKKTDNT